MLSQVVSMQINSIYLSTVKSEKISSGQVKSIYTKSGQANSH